MNNQSGSWEFFWMYSKDFGDDTNLCFYAASMYEGSYAANAGERDYGDNGKFWAEYSFDRDRDILRDQGSKLHANYYSNKQVKAAFDQRESEIYEQWETGRISTALRDRRLELFKAFKNWYFSEITQQRAYQAGDKGTQEEGGRRNDTIETMDVVSSFQEKFGKPISPYDSEQQQGADMLSIVDNLKLIFVERPGNYGLRQSGNACPEVSTVLERLSE